MTPVIFLLLTVAGGVGAAVRFIVDGVIREKLQTGYPWATTVINVSGSLLLGLLTGMAVSAAVPAGLNFVLGAGFLGGYTTFSTASYETVQLIRDRRYAASIASGFGMLVAAGAAAWLGLLLGIAL